MLPFKVEKNNQPQSEYICTFVACIYLSVCAVIFNIRNVTRADQAVFRALELSTRLSQLIALRNVSNWKKKENNNKSSTQQLIDCILSVSSPLIQPSHSMSTLWWTPPVKHWFLYSSVKNSMLMKWTWTRHPCAQAHACAEWMMSVGLKETHAYSQRTFISAMHFSYSTKRW